MRWLSPRVARQVEDNDGREVVFPDEYGRFNGISAGVDYTLRVAASAGQSAPVVRRGRSPAQWGGP